MRIAYLINQYPKVSHSFIRREILALERKGFQITRIALRGWEEKLFDDEDHSERELTHYVLRNSKFALIAATLLVMVTRPIQFLHALAVIFQIGRRAERPLPVHLIYLTEACFLVRLIKNESIQHVHAHFGTNSAEVAMLSHILGGPSWSFTVHGPEEFDKALSIGLPEKLKRCVFVVAVSSYGRSQLFRYIDHEHWSKVKVVHCGIDPNFFSDQHDLPLPAKTLICVGRLCEQKGQLFLVEASKILIDRGVRFNLVLAGDGEMRPAIEALIRQHKLESVIRITGWISGDQVRREILVARALVLPSFAEGLPVVIMEAMALGRPVISTFVAGIPELVRQDENGWLVPASDRDALVNAMQDCLDRSSSELEALGLAAKKLVVEMHDVNKEAAKLGRLFEDTLKSYDMGPIPSPRS
jgi:colanic acid/amylovoran biosynthesis glycosyltransferase